MKYYKDKKYLCMHGEIILFRIYYRSVIIVSFVTYTSVDTRFTISQIVMYMKAANICMELNINVIQSKVLNVIQSCSKTHS